MGAPGACCGQKHRLTRRHSGYCPMNRIDLSGRVALVGNAALHALWQRPCRPWLRRRCVLATSHIAVHARKALFSGQNANPHCSIDLTQPVECDLCSFARYPLLSVQSRSCGHRRANKRFTFWRVGMRRRRLFSISRGIRHEARNCRRQAHRPVTVDMAVRRDYDAGRRRPLEAAGRDHQPFTPPSRILNIHSGQRVCAWG